MFYVPLFLIIPLPPPLHPFLPPLLPCPLPPPLPPTLPTPLSLPLPPHHSLTCEVAQVSPHWLVTKEYLLVWAGTWHQGWWAIWDCLPPSRFRWWSQRHRGQSRKKNHHIIPKSITTTVPQWLQRLNYVVLKKNIFFMNPEKSIYLTG